MKPTCLARIPDAEPQIRAIGEHLIRSRVARLIAAHRPSIG